MIPDLRLGHHQTRDLPAGAPDTVRQRLASKANAARQMSVQQHGGKLLNVDQSWSLYPQRATLTWWWAVEHQGKSSVGQRDATSLVNMAQGLELLPPAS